MNVCYQFDKKQLEFVISLVILKNGKKDKRILR